MNVATHTSDRSAEAVTGRARRRVVWVILVVSVVASIVGLAELTQNRPDRADPESAAVIAVNLDLRGYTNDTTNAANAIWTVCLPTLGGFTEIVDPVSVTSDGFEVTVAPEPGENAQRRLRGCLNDTIVNRAQSTVARITRIEP